MGIARALPYIAFVASILAKVAPCPDLLSACSSSPACCCSARPLALAAEPNDPWPGLVQDIFNNRPMNDGSDVIGIEMPSRAEDAAIVPVTLRTKLSPGDIRRC